MSEVYVIGRVGVDLYPEQLNTPLEEVRTFEKFVGGFAGNISTGLARLEVDVGIVSAVGDDGHGRFVRAFLESEGVDCSSLGVHPTLRTALAFCEAWPPDRFPITFYRTPTCPDWEITPADLPKDLAAARLVYTSGTGLAREPSRGTTFAALDRARGHTVFDLDWREMLWDDSSAYGENVRRAVAFARIIIGGASEFAAAKIEPREVLALGAEIVVVKRGPAGATLIDKAGTRDVPGLSVPVVNGLGAGDALAAALGAALLEGREMDETIRRANAAGAIVASRLSCATAMPRSNEIDQLLARPVRATESARDPLARITATSGMVCGLALDHRDSLRVIARAHGYPDDDAALRLLKVELTKALAPVASVVLLDAELGTEAMRERGDTALVIPLESQGYESLGDGRITVLLHDMDPQRAAAMGAVGCKLLLPFRPDLVPIALRQQETAAHVIAACRAAGVLSIIEPIVYGEVPEFAAMVIETARLLARLGPDVLKLQYPGDAGSSRRVTAACGTVPWVLLGGGTNEEVFMTQLRDACAAGARGFIVGRTAWDVALLTDEVAQERAIAERAAFLGRCRLVTENATPAR
jgi:5-dehydro-2-deoxygluconokinase